jgi:GNAT superfamily N-acetyltransferase
MGFPRIIMNGLNLIFAEFAFDSETYSKAVELRRQILRAPLGLSWEPNAFEEEERSFHIGGFVDDILVATLVLRPIDVETIRMRQVAVVHEFQSNGIGSGLLIYAEGCAWRRGFKSICAHARESALGFYEHRGYTVSGEPFTEATVIHYYICKHHHQLSGAII